MSLPRSESSCARSGSPLVYVLNAAQIAMVLNGASDVGRGTMSGVARADQKNVPLLTFLLLNQFALVY